jgi:hypothetical protein
MLAKILAVVTVGMMAAAAGCSSSSDSFANIEDCIHANEGGSGGVQGAIAECIADDTIGGQKLSFDTVGDCELYVDMNSAEDAEDIDGGCQMYIDNK